MALILRKKVDDVQPGLLMMTTKTSSDQKYFIFQLSDYSQTVS